MIELKSVSKYYNVQKVRTAILSDVDLRIEQGEIIGIIGQSGAGKSTLMRLLNYLDQPDSGQILLNGDDLARLSQHQLRQVRRKIGMVFQHFNLLSSRTVFDNIALPLEIASGRKIDRQKITQLLDLVGLADKANDLPSQLSGGQKQRVAIARALVSEPEILLCDEATSALDTENTQAILKLLQKINQTLNVTIVLITHEMEVVKSICQRVLVLERGCVVEDRAILGFFAKPLSAVGKALVSHSFHLEIPPHIKQKLLEEPRIDETAADYQQLVQLTFVGHEAMHPVISDLALQYQVHANIIEAHLELLAGKQVGKMLCTVVGEKEAIANAVTYLESHNITIEVFGYVPSDCTATV